MRVRREVMPYGKRRSNQIFPCKKCPAHCDRGPAPLHLQIRLHKGWNTGLCAAMDLVRTAFWPASNVPLDHPRWKILWRQYCHGCLQFHHRWCDRRLRPGLVPVGGGMVCTSDSLSSDRCVRRKQIWKTIVAAWSADRI